MGFTLNQLEQERQIRKLQKKEDKDTKDYEQLSNLPKVNNVELKGDKTTSDLGINADNVMMPDGVTSVEDKIGEVASGLTIQLELNITIPATTNGRSSVQLPDHTIPQGAKVVGYIIDGVSSYSDAVIITAYKVFDSLRVTMISNVDEIPQITCKIILGITY